MFLLFRVLAATPWLVWNGEFFGWNRISNLVPDKLYSVIGSGLNFRVSSRDCWVSGLVLGFNFSSQVSFWKKKNILMFNEGSFIKKSSRETKFSAKMYFLGKTLPSFQNISSPKSSLKELNNNNEMLLLKRQSLSSVKFYNLIFCSPEKAPSRNMLNLKFCVFDKFARKKINRAAMLFKVLLLCLNLINVEISQALECKEPAHPRKFLLTNITMR